MSKMCELGIKLSKELHEKKIASYDASHNYQIEWEKWAEITDSEQATIKKMLHHAYDDCHNCYDDPNFLANIYVSSPTEMEF